MPTLAENIRNLRLFKRAEHLESAWRIILWWEMRRIPFNFIVGVTGLITCSVLFGLELLLKKDFLEGLAPGSPAIAIFAYAFLANVCFTGGWIVELFTRSFFKEKAKHFGEISFFLGMVFSVLLTLVPILIYVAAIAVHR